ncbi:GYDIA family GHMP kinase [Xanthomarina gelatinilytica]|uniref:GYDIA family GHMP kinase n=1 Tax=Xanthomarina gelatinilytica TaxID=1137281 RepID=UPI003AA8BCB2
MQKFQSNGKLLITGEYLVLDGAMALALPTKYGQHLSVEPINQRKLIWESLDKDNNKWFEYEYTFEEICFPIVYENEIRKYNNKIAKQLLKILFHLGRLNREHFINYDSAYNAKDIEVTDGLKITTKLTFPQDWGLGSSSTLINNMANWAQVDPYKLLELTFGGSGYDIACAQHNTAITYQIENNNRHIKEANFNPSFKDSLYFVYLNKKQNSRDGIAQYKANTSNKTQVIKEISEMTSQLISCSNLTDCNLLINRHEQIISSIIHQVPVKEALFSDFKGSVKSLGAWGGDFVLVTSEENPTAYFRSKGYDTIVPYPEMIK